MIQLFVTVATPTDQRTATAAMMWQYMTPHSQERFERDRTPLISLDEFEQRIEAGEVLALGANSYRAATADEIAAWRRLSTGGGIS